MPDSIAPVSGRLTVRAGLFVLMVLCWLPWFYLQSQMRVSADAAWLAEAASRVLAGQSMTGHYFDSNPPMSMLIYLPVAFLVQAGMPLWHALNLFTLLLTGASFGLSAVMLRFWPGLKKLTYWGFLSAWLLAVTAMSHFDFAQKDHLIAIMLPSFLLAQLMLVYPCGLPRRIQVAALILGMPFILLKPHYGLLAVVMIAFRAWKQRRLNVFGDDDFIILACGVVAYAGIVAGLFPDFFTDVLPLSLEFYVGQVLKDVYPLSAEVLFLTVCCTCLALMGGERWNHDRILAVFLSVMAFLSGVVFLVQWKGFPLHLLPALALMLPAMVVTGLLYAPGLAARKGAVAAMIVISAMLGCLVFTIEKPMPTHKSYRDSSFAAYLHAHVPPGETFYLQADSTNVIVPVAGYTGAKNASRFPLLWFLSGLEKICAEQGKACEKNPKVLYFSTKVAEDVRLGKPSFIGLYADPGPGEHFMEVLGTDPDFQKEWKKYSPAGQFLLNYREFYAGPLAETAKPRLYNIYMRR
ncbi:MAG: hypothetical protein JWO78_1289 [Micavibrio sp.]|nr:hypothetical protein [Micavibrio sp.]